MGSRRAASRPETGRRQTTRLPSDLNVSPQADQSRIPRASGLLLSTEWWVADRVTGAICGHHRRRLRQVGWASVLDAPSGGWAAGDPPPRDGNRVEILIDGAEALPRIAEELKRAESHVHIAGWYFSPDFALVRDGELQVLRNLLAEVAERVEVRVLVWAGAPLPLFRPRSLSSRMRHSVVEFSEQPPSGSAC